MIVSEPGGFRTKGKPRKSGRSARTLKQYDEKIFRFFISYLESREIPKSIGKINRDMIRGYIKYMRGDIVKFDGHEYKTDEYKTVGLATSTINTRLKTLRVFFSTIQDEGYILGNPMKGVKNLRCYRYRGFKYG